MDAVLLSVGLAGFLVKLAGLSLLFAVLAAVDFIAGGTRLVAQWMKDRTWDRLVADMPWATKGVTDGHHA